MESGSDESDIDSVIEDGDGSITRICPRFHNYADTNVDSDERASDHDSDVQTISDIVPGTPPDVELRSQRSHKYQMDRFKKDIISQEKDRGKIPNRKKKDYYVSPQRMSCKQSTKGARLGIPDAPKDTVVVAKEKPTCSLFLWNHKLSTNTVEGLLE
ncbi:hypothetical protein J6590_104359 [Homalodisca vitripennis]|nr:hypothetical protein J6590_104359 [Homalodisca vitripennis]